MHRQQLDLIQRNGSACCFLADLLEQIGYLLHILRLNRLFKLYVNLIAVGISNRSDNDLRIRERNILDGGLYASGLKRSRNFRERQRAVQSRPVVNQNGDGLAFLTQHQHVGVRRKPGTQPCLDGACGQLSID